MKDFCAMQKTTKEDAAVAATKEANRRTEFKGNLRTFVAKGVCVLQQLQSRLARHDRDDIEVARLAIELAKLEGSADPTPFLPKAARLLSGAASAVQEERDRPAREVEEQKQQLIQQELKRHVPWNDICYNGKREGGTGEATKPCSFEVHGEDGPTSFAWKRMTPKGFEKLLATHWLRVLNPKYKEVGKRIVKLFPQGRAESRLGEQARNIVKGSALWLNSDCEAHLEKVSNHEQANVFVTDWLKKASVEVPKYFLELAKTGALDKTTLYALLGTRSAGTRNRSLRAAASRQKK